MKAKKNRGNDDDADAEIASAVAAAEHLHKAALMLVSLGADLGEYQAFFDQGLMKHAWEELRDAAGEHSVPFAFWTEMSKAADLLGEAP